MPVLKARACGNAIVLPSIVTLASTLGSAADADAAAVASQAPTSAAVREWHFDITFSCNTCAGLSPVDTAEAGERGQASNEAGKHGAWKAMPFAMATCTWPPFRPVARG